jgi:hypothetical protein
MEGLKELWKIGVHVWDVATFNSQTKFNMEAMLMWTIHDLPSYGIVVGLVTKGYQGCPICSTYIISCVLKRMHKNVYACQHTRWLPMDHEFWVDLAMFDGFQKDGHPPLKVNAIDIIKHAKIWSQWIANGDLRKMTLQGGLESIGCPFCLNWNTIR